MGLTVPLMASATGTFFFRQFYRTIPDELVEAAQIDGGRHKRNGQAHIGVEPARCV